MAVTSTEEAMSLLNYGVTYRTYGWGNTSNSAKDSNHYLNTKSDSYPTALKHIINIFGNQVTKGVFTPDEIADFQSHVSLVSVLDNHDSYIGIDTLPAYCDHIISNSKQKYNDKDNKRLG